jgi:hypothetical protein
MNIFDKKYKKQTLTAFFALMFLSMCLSCLLALTFPGNNNESVQKTKPVVQSVTKVIPVITPSITTIVLSTIAIVPTLTIEPTVVELIEIVPTQEFVCDCQRDYNCEDFQLHKDAQSCYEQCGGNNWSELDGDDDGLACDSLPE